MLTRIKDRFDLHPERLIADTAYGSGSMLDWLVKRKIAPHISSSITNASFEAAMIELSMPTDRLIISAPACAARD